MTDPVGSVVDVVAATAPEIRAGLAGRRVYESDENPSGERQLEADVYADERLGERLLAIDGVAGYASEEREGVLGDGGDGHYVACDPLDGSSNLRTTAPRLASGPLSERRLAPHRHDDEPDAHICAIWGRGAH